jgi:hypothetical protein
MRAKKILLGLLIVILGTASNAQPKRHPQPNSDTHPLSHACTNSPHRDS